MRLQSDMFNRTDELQGELYDDQVGTIRSGTQAARSEAGRGYSAAVGAATNLRDDSAATGRYTRDANRTLNQNALRDSMGRTLATQNATIGANALTRDKGVHRAQQTVDANIGNYQREMDSGTGRLTADRDKNISAYQSALDAGTGRLTADRDKNIQGYEDAQAKSLGYFEPSIARGNDAGAAYGYNLGLGGKPAGYSGLSESEGTKYLMKTGRQEIEGGAAGAGNLFSGATAAALEKKRIGLASLDKENQMAQLMGLAGLGQGAANSAAGVRANYSDDIAGQRTGATSSINDLRAGYTGAMAGERTGATSAINALRGGYTGAMAGERSDYLNTANALDTASTSGITSARNLGTATLNGLQDVSANRGMGINTDYNNLMHGIRSDYANGITNAADVRAARGIDRANTNTANLGSARANRANLFGSAAGQYTTGMSSALGNKGDAKAAGAIGSGNALMGGLQNGLGIYGMMGGTFGSQAAQGAGQGQPWSNPFASMGSWFGR
jgi:hypothetical protein